MNKTQGVGIDLGTFHSVATFATNNNFEWTNHLQTGKTTRQQG